MPLTRGWSGRRGPTNTDCDVAATVQVHVGHKVFDPRGFQVLKERRYVDSRFGGQRDFRFGDRLALGIEHQTAGLGLDQHGAALARLVDPAGALLGHEVLGDLCFGLGGGLLQAGAAGGLLRARLDLAGESRGLTAADQTFELT